MWHYAMQQMHVSPEECQQTSYIHPKGDMVKQSDFPTEHASLRTDVQFDKMTDASVTM